MFDTAELRLWDSQRLGQGHPTISLGKCLILLNCNCGTLFVSNIMRKLLHLSSQNVQNKSAMALILNMAGGSTAQWDDGQASQCLAPLCVCFQMCSVLISIPPLLAASVPLLCQIWSSATLQVHTNKSQTKYFNNLWNSYILQIWQ